MTREELIEDLERGYEAQLGLYDPDDPLIDDPEFNARYVVDSRTIVLIEPAQ